MRELPLKNTKDKLVFCKIINLMAELGSEIGFVEQLFMPFSYHEPQFLDFFELSPRKIKSNAWPGTVSCDKEANIYYVNKANLLFDFMKKHINGFVDFLSPYFFEDMHIFHNNEIIFYSISHENDFVIIENKITYDFIKENKFLS